MKRRVILLVWVLLTLTSMGVAGYNLYWIARYFANPPATLLSALAETGLALGVFFALNMLFVLIIYLCFFIVAQLIFLRRANERYAVAVSVMLLAFGTVNAAPIIPEFLQFFFDPPLWYAAPFYALNILAWTLLTPFLLSYPDGKFVPRWAIAVGVLGAIVSFFWASNAETFSMVQGFWAVALTVAAAFEYGAILFIQVWRYRHYYSPLQKQQAKWFLYGVAITALVLIPITPITPYFADPTVPPVQLLWAQLLYMLFGLGFIALPISIGIAILRYRLWDIDILIRKTLTYALVAVLLAAVYFGSVILLQRAFATLSGQQSEIITVFSTLAIAALFVPLRNRIQQIIDRRFYRKKYDAQAVLQKFSVTVRDETDMEKLTGSLLVVVNDTMQPTNVSVWLARGSDEVTR